MIKSLRIKNFKGWSDTTEIRMAPITLFFGKNSAGKSSIAQFILMLKMTASSNDLKALFQTGGSRFEDQIDLGTFKDIIHKHSIDNVLSGELSWEAPDLVLAGEYGSFNNVKLKFESKLLATGASSLLNFCYELTGKTGETLNIGMSNESGTWKKITKGINLKAAIGRQWSIGKPIKFYDFSTEFTKRFQNAQFVQELPFSFEKVMKRVAYLGPLRSKAQRYYTWNGESTEDVGYEGSRTVPLLLSSKERMINFFSKSPRMKMQHAIAHQLNKVGLIKEFEIKSSDDMRFNTVLVKTSSNSQLVALPDVGCGVSQVLPVLTQLFATPKDSILIFEQPELHLHPTAQANLADVVIDAINSTENGKKRNVQLLIESHSEHFLRRLQTRIAEKTLSLNDVACYYIDESNEGNSVLVDLKFNEFGYITNWPDNFFGDLMTEALKQQEAMLKLRKSRKE